MPKKSSSKLLLSCLLVFFSSISSYASVIPDGGIDSPKVQQSEKTYVKWLPEIIGDTVDIYLWNSDFSTFDTIATNYVDTLGIYEWDVASNQSIGDYFKIKIKAFSSDTFAISTDFFKIHSSGSAKISTFSDNDDEIPEKENQFAINLDNISPNPFNGLAEIQYFLSKLGWAKLRIISSNGQVIANLIDKYVKGGWHTLIVNGSGLSTGAYFLVFEAEGLIISKLIQKMH